MNNSKKIHDSVRQNENTVKKSQKHDANLRKNSTLYFQIGLIMCLLASYGALEMSFASNGVTYEPPKIEVQDDFVYVMPDFKVEKTKEPEQKQVKKQPKQKDPDLKIVKNDTKTKEPIDDIVQKVPVDKIPVLDTDDGILDIVDPNDNEPVNILAVQKVPIYPGCESETSNDGRRKCMSDKLARLVQRKFNTNIAPDLGLTGKQQIFVSFKINKNGDVEILKTRAPHPKLDREAKRVVGKIPNMEPGRNDNTPVEVLYMLPIKFDIQ